MTPCRLEGRGPARRLTLARLESLPGIVHGFTVKGSIPEEAVAEAAGRPMPLVTLRQVHGATVRVIREGEPLPDQGPDRPQGDALLSRRTDAAFGIAVADCVPIVLAEPRSGWVGAVHAGWRGTAEGVLRAAIAAGTTEGVGPEALVVGMGPSIGPCCLEVGDEVVEALLRKDPGASAAVRREAAKPHVDLVEMNRRQAIAAGVPADRIAAAGLCTVCEPDLLESYRRSRGAPGRMVGFVARREAVLLTS